MARQPLSQAQIAQLRRNAKRLLKKEAHRNYHDILDQIARQRQYSNWYALIVANRSAHDAPSTLDGIPNPIGLSLALQVGVVIEAQGPAACYRFEHVARPEAAYTELSYDDELEFEMYPVEESDAEAKERQSRHWAKTRVRVYDRMRGTARDPGVFDLEFLDQDDRTGELQTVYRRESIDALSHAQWVPMLFTFLLADHLERALEPIPPAA